MWAEPATNEFMAPKTEVSHARCNFTRGVEPVSIPLIKYRPCLDQTTFKDPVNLQNLICWLFMGRFYPLRSIVCMRWLQRRCVVKACCLNRCGMSKLRYRSFRNRATHAAATERIRSPALVRVKAEPGLTSSYEEASEVLGFLSISVLT